MVPMVDLGAQHAALREELGRALGNVIERQEFVLGPSVERFERALAEFLDVPHVVGLKSGSDALLVALLALGVGPGDEVITTPFTFFATAGAVVRAGASPVFADVRDDTLALDPRAAAESAGPRTRALIAVHLFGQPANLAELGAMARDRGIALVEDAAQSLGARYAGRMTGSFGHAGCFSFHPAKPLGAFGDAGALATGDPDVAERARRLRVHGAGAKYEHSVPRGGNHRLDALQAAILTTKLPHFPGWLEERAAIAVAYDQGLSGIPGLSLPPRVPGTRPSHALYTVRVKDGRRDALKAHLLARGIESAVHYPRPLHLQPAFAELGLRQGSLPVAEAAAGEVLSLPIFPELGARRERVIEAVSSFFGPS